MLPYIPKLKILGPYINKKEGKDRERAAKEEKEMIGCKGKGETEKRKKRNRRKRQRKGKEKKNSLHGFAL